MTRSFFVGTWTAAAVLLLAAACLAQGTNGNTAPGPRTFAGETLTYDANVRKLRVSISVAQLTFRTSETDDGHLRITSEAVSEGALIRFFRYSFLQQYESVAEVEPFRIRRTRKHDVQKQRIRDSEAVFDYSDRRVTFIENDPNDPNRPPRTIASNIGDHVHDVVSGIYALRVMPLALRDRFELQISDSGLVYTVPVTVTKRESLKTALGRVMCLRVEPEVFGPGRLIEQKGRMTIWITDDARRIPVRGEIDAGFGRINVKLESATRTPPAR